MKEQDYMNIMSTIRAEYIEEAISWDGAERRRIRQIRRMTASFGAVAAAVAIVVGVVAYKEHTKKPDIATSEAESSIAEETEQTENIFGGQGELRIHSAVFGKIYFQDDAYWYHNGLRWSAGGGISTYYEEPAGFFADSTQMYRVHDDKIFTLDSFGKETLLVDASEWQDIRPETDQVLSVKKEGDSLLFSLDTMSQYPEIVVVNLKTGEAQTLVDSSLSETFGGDADGFYAFNWDAGNFYHFDPSGNITGNEPVFALADDQHLCSAAFADDTIYAIYQKYDEARHDFNEQLYLVTCNLKTDQISMEKPLSAGCSVLSDQNCYRAAFEDGKFNVYKSPITLIEQNIVRKYSVTADEIWELTGQALPNLIDLDITEPDDTMIMTFPEQMDNGELCVTKHGEEGVMIDTNTGKVLYFGRNYNAADAPETTAPETGSTTAPDDAAQGTTAAQDTAAAPETTLNAATTSALSETTAATTSQSADKLTEEQCITYAKDLLDRYVQTYENYVFGDHVAVDSTDQKTVPSDNPDYSTRYDRVTAVATANDLRKIFAEVVTGSEYDYFNKIAFGDNVYGLPYYREFDGKLYAAETGKGGEFFGWMWDTLKISSITADSFTATVSQTGYGNEIETFTFDIVNTEDGFRISKSSPRLHEQDSNG
ncbi:MAG: hypothetical protein IKI77_06875 [Oscillospiraceae bacterium]|nr:hypothetical protein [Oscillospiraceae bacterium]